MMTTETASFMSARIGVLKSLFVLALARDPLAGQLGHDLRLRG